jgi:hypothetical protein
MLVGIILSHGLGVWPMFSAFFLYVYEQNLYEKQLNHASIRLTACLPPEVQAETVKHFEGGAQEEQRTLQETAASRPALRPTFTGRLNCAAPSNANPHPTISRRKRPKVGRKYLM